MSEPTLSNLLDDAALYSFEHQLHLADVVGDRGWSVDLRAGRFTLTGDEPIECERMHLLGSAAPGPRSWLWSWDNPSVPDTVTELAWSVRENGIRYGISELADAEVPFADLPSRSDLPENVVNVFMDAAKALSGVWTGYSGPIGGGSRAAFLIEHPSFRLPAPESPRVIRVLQQALVEFPITDHRRAVHSYANHRGLDIDWSPDHRRATLTGPGLTATLAFDEWARTTNIDAELTSTNET